MPFMNKKLNKILSENKSYFKSFPGTDGKDKVLSSLEYYSNLVTFLCSTPYSKKVQKISR